MGRMRIYYCAEIGKNGFIFDKKLEKYKPQQFFEAKFKIKLDRTAKTIAIKSYPSDITNDTYNCTALFAPTFPDDLYCTNTLYQFNFNSYNGRFVLTMGAGYMGGDGDTIGVSYGTCDKFLTH